MRQRGTRAGVIDPKASGFAGADRLRCAPPSGGFLSSTDHDVTSHAAFEGMFDRALKPSGAFAADLLRLGYDPERPELNYPTPTWLKALDLARAHACPHLAPDAADRELGRRFIEGFLETITGKFVKLALPLVGPDAMIRRLPRYYGSTQSAGTTEVFEEAPRQYRVRFVNRYSRPEFLAGMLEAVPGLAFRVTVLTHTAEGSELRVTW